MVHFWGDGIAQSLFSKFTAYQSLESTCIGLIGSNNFFSLQQQIVCIIVCHVHLTTNIDYPQIRKLDKSGNWKNNYKEYLMPLKMPKYAKNMWYAHFAKICEKCGKVPNMRQSHIHVFLTCLNIIHGTIFAINFLQTTRSYLLQIVHSDKTSHLHYKICIIFTILNDMFILKWKRGQVPCLKHVAPPFIGET